jgi:hypothetical protein
MTTSAPAIPYIYCVKKENLQHYSTSPVWMKILAFLTAITTAFYAFHLIMDLFFSDQFEAARWVKEIYFYIGIFFPGFLILTGTFHENKVRNRIVWCAALVFGGCILLNIPNSLEIIDIYHLQYPTGLALLTLLVVAIIHFVKKQKNAVDVLKLLWLFSLTYTYIVPNVVVKYHQAGWFLLAMQVLYPIMMTTALIQFFNKPKT